MAVKQLTFVNNNPPQCDAGWLNSVKSEVNKVISSTGDTPVDGTLDQLSKATSEYSGRGDFYNDTGAVDAYVLSATGTLSTPDKYFNGLRIRYRPANANTGAATVNVAGLGVKNIKLSDGAQDPAAGYIPANEDVMMAYDGTNFRLLLSPGLPSTTPITTRGDIIVGNPSAAPVRLPVGGAATYLRSDGTDPVYNTIQQTDLPVASISGQAKAWVNFNGTGVLAIRSDFGISSVVDLGGPQGNYDINFTTAFVDTNYLNVNNTQVGGMSRYLTGASAASEAGYFNKTTTSIEFVTQSGGNGAQIDMFDVNLVFFGDQ